MSITASKIADLLQGEVIGSGDVELTGFAPAESARDGDLTFAEKESYFLAAEQSRASAILVTEHFRPTQKVLIRVPNARVAMARLLPVFFPPEEFPAGIHATAVVDPAANIDPTAHIGPYAVIGANVRIGARSVLLGGNHIGRDTQIGEDSRLYAGVTVYHRCTIGDRVIVHSGTVIGADGFGYTLDSGQHRKVLQVGVVIIGNDVEIGSNSSLDRGTLGATVIGEGTKIDNLVQIAHNAKIGRHCLIFSQTGIAGSTEVGDYTVIAAQAGITGHLKVGAQVIVGAKSGVMRDVPAKTNVLGVPAVDGQQAKRQWVATQKLPDIIRRVRKLEKQLAQPGVDTD